MNILLTNNRINIKFNY